MAIRRLKEHVLTQLPPKRRQIIRLSLRKADIISAMVATKVETRNASEKNLNEERMLEPIHESFASRRCIVQLSYQELGVAKLSGFREWLSLHPIISEVDDAENMDRSLNSHKMIIFAHHHKVLDGIQEFICEKGIGFVRIDGNTLARDRQLAVHSFRSSAKVKIAIIGIEAGGVGIDFSSAQNVVFLELPRSPSAMLQAEGRAHRQGQINAVNIYIFCAKDSLDELCWQNLNKSLQRVSSVTDGKYDAVQEIVVEDVTYLEASCRSDKSSVDRIMENEESGESREELAKLPNITGSQDVQSHELGNKSWEQTRRGNLSQSDNFCGKADISSTRQMEEGFRLQMESEGNASQVKVESCDRVSCEINGYGVEKEEETFIAVAENNAGGHMPSLLAKEDCYNQVNSLRFEVSRYTGRIHLYSCTPGLDSRPRPLFESFRPEEIELLNSSDSYNNNQACGLFKEKPTYLPAIKAFIIEWKKLRPIKQKRLIGKPLQLPLMTELWFLSESKKHNSQGLLKSGSKHRTRPLQEINNPLPSNATWRDVHLRGGSRKRQNVFTQGWTSTEEPLCKLCQAPCIGNNAKRPEFLEDLFCNLTCYEEFRIRTSNRYIRQELFKIEHGICTNCQLDCHQLVLHLKPLSLSMRREYIKKVAPKVAMQKNLLDKLVKEPTEGNSWHADHIVPVYRGGGECTLENMRTLCVACHSEVTAAQCTERRLARTRAKKQLKLIMTDLKKCKAQRPNANLASYQHSSDILVEDELIVRVPGSAYSEEDKSTATDLENPT